MVVKIPYPMIVSAFDWDGRSALEMFKVIHHAINPSAASVPAASTEDAFEQPQEVIKGTVYELLDAFTPFDMSALCHLFPIRSHASPNMTSLLPSLWKEFVETNGMQPVQIFIAGPPKSSKTEFAKFLAAR
jgi:hypothetical protein